MPNGEKTKSNGYWWKFLVSSIISLIIGIAVGVGVQTYNVFLTKKTEQETKRTLKAKISQENKVKKKRLNEELAIGKKRLDEDYQAWSDTMSPVFAAQRDSFRKSFPDYSKVRNDPTFLARYNNFKQEHISNKIAIKKREIERQKRDLERKINTEKEDLDMLLDF